MTRTQYQCFHHETPIGHAHDFATTAELFLLFSTPATSDYTVRPVARTTDDPESPTDQRTA